MRLAAVVFSVVLVAFTCLVVVTDGPPTEAIYVVLTLALVLVPIFSLVVLLQDRAGRGGAGVPVKQDARPAEKKGGGRLSPGPALRTAAIFCNIVMLGLSCWALVDQYPHPEEDGFLAYVLVVMVTPILNMVALLRSGGRSERRVAGAG